LAANKAAEEDWQRACEAYQQALRADPKYREAVRTFIDLQNREPQRVKGIFWIYKNVVCRLNSNEPAPMRELATDALLIKHHVLRRQRDYEKVRREVEALENMEKLEGVMREPIPDAVRLFVWQRDGGKCVKCGARERLEFDHIIPVAAGGSSTERNVQLLCESCNRSKGAMI
jgi:5-methylcytosine-specific restriction endonuclease McrA